MELLTITSLYPSAARPRHGIFVERRLARIVQCGDIRARVIAPVPWFPMLNGTSYAVAPPREHREGIEVLHPRFLAIPKLGMYTTPYWLWRAVAPVVEDMVARGDDFDVIDAHYLYPDGVVAAMIARQFNKPLVITARGTDVNVLPRYRIPRRRILTAAEMASDIIAVSEALRQRLIELGVPELKVSTLRNGVDVDRFRPVPRTDARRALDFEGTVLLSVGNLVEVKAQHLAIRALPALPDAMLVIVGEGELRARLEHLARKLDVAHRVRFVGNVVTDALIEYYSGADVLVHPSLREGLPNVILEAVSCGLPVVATNCGGIPEILSGTAAGVLIEGPSVGCLIDGVRKLLAEYPSRACVRQWARKFSWDVTVEQQRELYARLTVPVEAGA